MLLLSQTLVAYGVVVRPMTTPRGRLTAYFEFGRVLWSHSHGAAEVAMARGQERGSAEALLIHAGRVHLMVAFRPDRA